MWTLAQAQLPQKVIWILPLCTVPLPSLSHPLQLLILSLEGVAGSDSGRGSQGRTLGRGWWQDFCVSIFWPCHFAFALPGDLFSLSLWL